MNSALRAQFCSAEVCRRVLNYAEVWKIDMFSRSLTTVGLGRYRDTAEEYSMTGKRVGGLISNFSKGSHIV